MTADEAVFVLGGKGAKSPATLRLKLGEGNPAAEIEALDRQSGYVNYYVGKDTGRWQTKVQRFAKVRYKSVYPGIDLVYHGSQQQLEYDFVVAPGADPRAIQLGFSADAANLSLSLSEDGDLLVETAGKTLRQKKPVAYQEIDGKRHTVDADYKVHRAENGAQQVTLALGDYDRAQPLVIDPVLVYSSYLGGAANDGALAVAVDNVGAVYVTGITDSVNFPVTDGTTHVSGHFDAFVAKLTPAGLGATDLIYATYLGGRAWPFPGLPQTVGQGIAVDGGGNAHVVGRTQATDFPTTQGAFQRQLNGFEDAFITRLDAAGAISYSTYFGGSSSDGGRAIALHPLGDVYIAGDANPGNFPTTAGAHREGALSSDVFFARLRLAGQGPADLIYSTLLGGSRADRGAAIGIDANGRAHLTGITESSDFPATPGAFQTTPGNPGDNDGDAFYAVINPAGGGSSDLEYATYLGGTDTDEGKAIAVAGGRAYLTGRTFADFPTTPGAFSQTASPFFSDGFVAVINPRGQGAVDLEYSTRLGGNRSDEPNGIAVDGLGRIWVAGTTGSAEFPALMNTGSAFPEAFVTVLMPVGNGANDLVFSMTFGGNPLPNGNSLDIAQAIALDSTDRAYIVGSTISTDFPVTPGAFQSTHAGGFTDAFVSIIDLNQLAAATALQLLSSANPSFVGQSVTFTAALTSASPQVPTGTVRFEDNGTPLATVNINAQGNAIFTTSALTLGNHTIAAIYDGNATFLASSNSILQRVTQAVDLAITKTVSAAVGQVGQQLTYTLQVSNNSANDGTGVVVRDTLPANVTVNSLPAGCTQAGNVVTCALGNFAAKSNLTLTIVVTPTAPGVFTNTATIGGNEADPAPGNNFSSVTTTVDAAELAVTLTDAPDPIAVGGTLVYTIGVSNAGPSTATNVTLTFTRDASLFFASFSSSGLQGAACAGQTIITCSFASLPSGTKGTITFGFATTAVGTISATATITSPNPDPNTANNSANTTTRVALVADLAITTSATPDPVIVNGTITYTITWSNLGPAATIGPTATGELSGAVAFDVNSLGGPGAGFAQCKITATTFTCQVGRLFGGENATITLQARPTSLGTVTLSVGVSGAEVDPDTSNNRAFVSTTVALAPLAPIYTQGASYRIEMPPQALSPIYTEGASYRIEPPPLALAPIYTQGASYRIQEVDELAPIYTQGASYMIGNTPPGTDITVQAGGVTITFASVLVAGNTTVTPISPASVGQLPSGYAVIGNLAFQIITDAIVSGPITLTFTVPSVNDAQVFANLRVLHSENFKLIDRTILPPNSPAPNFASRSISARVGSLSPFVIALLGPRGIKQSVVDELIALRASVTDKLEGMKLDDAVRNLQQSLSSAYWIDEIRLAPRFGDQVFQAEKRAVTSLQTLMTQKKSSLSQAVLRSFISRIIDADRLLAVIAIDDAIAAQGISSELKKARDELARADADVANNKSESGIEHYRQAWKMALKAVGK